MSTPDVIIGRLRRALGVVSAGVALTAAAQTGRVVSSVLDAGGGRGEAGSIVNIGSIGGIVGPSPQTAGVSGTLVNRSGFTGQLMDAVQLDLTANPAVVPPGQTSQLGGVAVMDDGSLLQLGDGDLSWADGGALPDVLITATGEASPLSLISSNTLASVTGVFQGVAGTLDLLFVPSYAPIIRIAPESQGVNAGSPVSFSVVADGVPPFGYQWFWNGIAIDQATNSTLELLNVQPRDQGPFQVRVTNVFGFVSQTGILSVADADVPAGISRVSVRPSVVAEEIANPDVAVLIERQATVTLRVEVDGTATAPIFYQWKLNGENLTDRPAAEHSGSLADRGGLIGATSNVLTLSGVKFADAGVYSVTVQNGLGITNSQPIPLSFHLPELPKSGERPISDQLNAGVSSKNTSEPVGFVWRALGGGVVSVTTAGSGFDTLLAIRSDHDGLSVTNDESGGFHTSLLEFNAVEGEDYTIEVDGVAGATGPILLQWQLSPGRIRMPEIVEPPKGLTLPLAPDGRFSGSNAVFVAKVRSLEGTRYTWHRNGAAFQEGTVEHGNPDTVQLVITNVGPTDIASYALVVTDFDGAHEVVSEPVSLEAGTDVNVQAVDRRNDLPVDGNSPGGGLAPIRIGVLRDQIQRLRTPRSRLAPAGQVNAGVTGVHYFNNTKATVDLNEPGGTGIDWKTEWFRLTSDARAEIVVDTEGSEVDTRMTVLRDQTILDANDDSRVGVTFSKVVFTVEPGSQYDIKIGVARNQSGLVRLNWSGSITNFEWIATQTPRRGFLRIDRADSGIERVVTVQHAASSTEATERIDVLFWEDTQGFTIVPAVASYYYWVGVETLPNRPVEAPLVSDDVWTGRDGLQAGLIQQEEGLRYLEITWEGSGMSLFHTQELGGAWMEQTEILTEKTRNSVRFPADDRRHFFQLRPAP